jgi:two-component system response regulator AlgR
MRVLIADDEAPARQRLADLVGDLEGFEVAGTAANGIDAIDMAERTAAEIVLLDVRMPGMDGIETARHLGTLDKPPAVIFTTAYDAYALEAFETAAAGYLLKPVRRARLLEALERARRPTRAQFAALGGGEGGGRRARSHIAARVGGRLSLIPLSEIRCFVADQKYVAVHHGAGIDLIDESLKALEEEFDKEFTRIHRGALVAMAHVDTVRKDDRGQLHVRLKGSDEELTVSRRHTAGFRQRLRSG